jgi:hypothetical protein
MISGCKSLRMPTLKGPKLPLQNRLRTAMSSENAYDPCAHLALNSLRLEAPTLAPTNCYGMRLWKTPIRIAVPTWDQLLLPGVMANSMQAERL